MNEINCSEFEHYKKMVDALCESLHKDKGTVSNTALVMVSQFYGLFIITTGSPFEQVIIVAKKSMVCCFQK